MERILIVRLGAMGDVLHAIPAVLGLRRAMPETEIHWMVERRWTALLPQGVHPVVVDTKQWRRQMLGAETRAAVRGLRAQRFGVGIDLQGAAKSAVLGKLAARQLYGSVEMREWPARFFYDGMIETRSAHVIDQAREIVGAVLERELPHPDSKEIGTVFAVDVAAEAWADGVEQKKRFALLNPAAGWAAKQWPEERYGELAQRLARAGLGVLINAGPGEEAIAAAALRTSAGAATIVSGTIPQLIALTRRAALFIGGDTGPMHLAAMLGVPTVAIFGPTDPARNGPYYERTAVVRHAKSRTSYSHGHIADPGLLAITVDEVMTAAERVLA